MILLKEYEHVKIKKSGIIGTIVDISNIDGIEIYTVESDSEGTPGGYGGKWKLFDCKKEDLEPLPEHG